MTTEPQINYYENQDLQGDWQFVYLTDLVNNFLVTHTGDDTVIGKISRHRIVTLAKRAVQEFHYSVVGKVKAVELELDNNLDIIKPYDYVKAVRISWLDEQTGQFRPMSQNRRVNTTAVAHLQDNLAYILFDDQGNVLEGSSATELINSQPQTNENGQYFWNNCWWNYRCFDNQHWGMATDVNYNGTFTENDQRIHFSSNVASNIIVLEYITDGLFTEDETQIRIHKFAEDAFYAWLYDRLLETKIGVPEYTKRAAKKNCDALMRNAKIRLMGVTVSDIREMINANKRWIK